jgi:ParB family chromosome partitioning protein
LRRKLRHFGEGLPRLKFVGIDAYVAVGGVIKDLFQSDHDGYLADPALLDSLAADKLEATAESLRAEGWKWVEIMPRLDHSELGKFGSVEPKRQKLSPEDSKA